MTQYDVLTIGNAIVDVIAKTDDKFLLDNSIIKGAMNLIDADRAEHLYAQMGQAIEVSGGSAANTACGVASLGGQVAYMGKVADDALGAVFAHDIHAQKVAFDTPRLKDGAPTARCMIFTTPDGERSMNTYLGACVEFGPDDIEEDKIAAAKIIYFEGYLWDPALAKKAMRLAAKIAHDNGNKVAISLSDAFCVDRYRAEFLELIRSHTVDIVFANESELLALYQTTSFDTAIAAIRQDMGDYACITRAEKGAVVVSGNDTCAIEAFPIDKMVDATGAGDIFAAGFLYGATHDLTLEQSARLGAFCASKVIQQVGSRLQLSLRDLAVEAGLLA